MKIGEVIQWYWQFEDGEWWEYREEVLAIVECPRCFADIALVAETDGWIEDENHRWKHDSYGPATRIHCGLLIADWWEGCFSYELDEKDDTSVVHHGQKGLWDDYDLSE